MFGFRAPAMLAMALALGACAAPATRQTYEPPGIDMSTRGTEFHVSVLEVRVPESLRVSEANSYFPIADIVWRGDPMGDRHAQVKALLEEGIGRGVATMEGETPVAMVVELERFHGVSQKARYTVGGIHNIRFRLSLHDPATGDLLAGPERINASLRALGGQAAIDADARGETQKARITAHLENVMRAHFSPDMLAGR